MRFTLDIKAEFDSETHQVSVVSASATAQVTPEPEPQTEPTPATATEPATAARTWTRYSVPIAEVWRAPQIGNPGAKAAWAYCSGATDPSTGDHLAVGLGGHADSANKAAYRLRARSWSRLRNDDSAVAPDADTVGISYRDIKGNPLSAHTAAGDVIIGEYLYRAGYAPYNPDGNGNGGDWRLHIPTLTWQELTRNPQGAITIGVDVDGVLHRWGTRGVCRYNADGTWTNADYSSIWGWLDGSVPDKGVGAYDPDSGLIAINSANGLRLWRVNDITNAQLIKPVWTGATEIVGKSKGGLVKSAHLGQFVAYNPTVSATDVFLINPITYLITRVAIGGDAPEVPDMQGFGVWHNFWCDGAKLCLLTPPNDYAEVRL